MLTIVTFLGYLTGGQFTPKYGGQFAPKSGGQFVPKFGGQFVRNLQ